MTTINADELFADFMLVVELPLAMGGEQLGNAYARQRWRIPALAEISDEMELSAVVDVRFRGDTFPVTVHVPLSVARVCDTVTFRAKQQQVVPSSVEYRFGDQPAPAPARRTVTFSDGRTATIEDTLSEMGARRG